MTNTGPGFPHPLSSCGLSGVDIEIPVKEMNRGWTIFQLDDGRDVFTVIQPKVFFGSKTQAALIEWLAFHGLDASRILVDTPVIVDWENHTITTELFRVDGNGTPILRDGDVICDEVVEQNEAGPLPWPAVIMEDQNVG